MGTDREIESSFDAMYDLNRDGVLDPVEQGFQLDDMNADLEADNEDEEDDPEIDDFDHDDDLDIEDDDDEVRFGSETYDWDRFYPEHVDDDIVEMMIDEDVSLVQGAGVDEGDLPDALSNLYNSDHQMKVVKDLLADGYELEPSDLNDTYGNEGYCDVVEYMFKHYKGEFDKDFIMDTIDKGDDIPLALLLSRADRFVEFDHDEVEEILNTYYDPEEKEVKKLLSMMDDDLDRDEVEDLLNAIPSGMEDLVRKYVNKLPFADKVDILELYY